MTPRDIPRIITMPLFLTVGVGKYNYNDIEILSFDASEFRSEGNETILMLKTEITLELPKEINTKAHFIGVLENRKKGVEAEYHLKVKEIQDQIDMLLINEQLGVA